MSPSAKRKHFLEKKRFVGAKSVLIVDDDDETREMLKLILRPLGAMLYLARSGAEALRFMQGIEPDVVLLDVCMPGMNGFETCAKIQEQVQAPVIMLTVLDRTDDRVRALDAGASAYLTKPCHPHVLTNLVQQALQTPSLFH